MTHTEYTKINDSWVIVITEQEAKENKTDNIYYLDNVSDTVDYNNWKRAKDDDIEKKDFFVIDLDLRKQAKDLLDEDLSNEDIIDYATFLSRWIEDDEFFKEWDKIVFSGNWLHIYYKGNADTFSKEEYASWVARIYRRWDEIVWSNIYKADAACKNIARILRLPWSINQKNWAEVFVVLEQNTMSRLFNSIKLLAKKEQQEQQQEKAKKEKEIAERLSKYWQDWNNFYDEINKIEAYTIAQVLLPEFPYDWKKNFKNKKWWLTWYFYNSETNTICNGGSQYFSWGWSESCFNNFSIIKNWYSFDDAQTFNFFKKIIWT